MRTVHVVGIGAGSPGHLTLDAVDVLGAVDVVLLLAKRGAAGELTDAGAALPARFAPQGTVVRRQDAHRQRGTTEEGHYLQTTQQWRDERLALYEEGVAGEVPARGGGAPPG